MAFRFQAESPAAELSVFELERFTHGHTGRPDAIPWYTLGVSESEREAFQFATKVPSSGELRLPRLRPGRHGLWILSNVWKKFETEVTLAPGGRELVFAALEPR